MDKKDQRKKFIEKLKAEFPEKKSFLEGLRKNDDYSIERLLSDSIGLGMLPEEIVRAFKEGRQEEIRKRAEASIRRQRLLYEWRDLKIKGLV